MYKYVDDILYNYILDNISFVYLDRKRKKL